jgi:hypothetical protein
VGLGLSRKRSHASCALCFLEVLLRKLPFPLFTENPRRGLLGNLKMRRFYTKNGPFGIAYK